MRQGPGHLQAAGKKDTPPAAVISPPGDFKGKDMTAEAILKEPARLEKQILELCDLVESLQGLRSTKGTEPRVQTSGHRDSVGDAAAKIAELKDRIQELNSRRKWLIYERIPELLEQVTDDEYLGRGTITLHILCGQTMEKTAKDLKTSYATAYKYEKAGLRQIQAYLDNQQTNDDERM